MRPLLGSEAKDRGDALTKDEGHLAVLELSRRIPQQPQESGAVAVRPGQSQGPRAGVRHNVLISLQVARDYIEEVKDVPHTRGYGSIQDFVGYHSMWSFQSLIPFSS